MKEKHDADVEYIMSLISLIRGDKAIIRVAVKDQNGNAIPNMPITNITSAEGNTVSTNNAGIAEGYTRAATAFYPKINNYVDVGSLTRSPNTLDLIAGNTYNFTITLKHNNFYGTSSSSTIAFSPMTKKISFSIVAGGGGGFTPYGNAGDGAVQGIGCGGGGGGCITVDNYGVTPYTLYSISIGSGGRGASGQAGVFTAPLRGGSSNAFGIYVTGGSPGAVTTGGSGGQNAGEGGSANSRTGKDGTGVMYTSYTTETKSPGGGGAGSHTSSANRGGNSGGGGGACFTTTSSGRTESVGGSDGYRGGGGGGGNDYGYRKANAGGSGYCGIRMHYGAV